MVIPIGKKYLLFRSPLSNKYFPPQPDGKLPSHPLRELEVSFNKMFSLYIHAYYSYNTICSVYLYEIGETIEDGFVIVVLIKNIVNDQKGVENGVWESTNFVTVNFTHEKNQKGEIKTNYKLITTVLLQMKFDHKICGKINLSGNVTRQVNIKKIKH
jgi:capping protein beta